MRKSSYKAPKKRLDTVAPAAATTQTTQEKPKYYSIFNKRTLKPAQNNGETASSNSRDVLPEDVSSPPPSDPIEPEMDAPEPKEEVNPTKMTSIFSLTVPTLPSSATLKAPSTKRPKSRQNSMTKAKRKTTTARPKSKLTASLNTTTSSEHSLSSSPAPLDDVPATVEEVAPVAGPSTGLSSPLPQISLSSSGRSSPDVIHLLDSDSPAGVEEIPTPAVAVGPTPSASQPKAAREPLAKSFHPFFASRKLKEPPVPATPPDFHIVVDEEEARPNTHPGSQNDPIRISVPPSSPISTTPLKPPAAKRRKIEAKDAPWPSAPLQHIRGPQSNILDLRNPLNFPLRTPPDDSHMVPSDADRDVWSYPMPDLATRQTLHPHPRPQPPESRTIETLLDSIPQNHLSMPAFRPLLEHIEEGSHHLDGLQELWSDLWRPRRANHVLGNETNAMYLKSWLQTLELGVETIVTAVPSGQGPVDSGPKTKAKNPKGLKRPAVVRTVKKSPPKKKKRRRTGYGSDDWIVSDEEEDESEEEEEEPQEEQPLHFRPSMSPCKPIGGHSSLRSQRIVEEPSPIRQFNPLTNAILLAGPSGSGKTAAVYACAEELGWEVYEVYPGMGKRSGTNLAAIVEGVSKNHVLGVAAPPAKKPPVREKVPVNSSQHGGIQTFFNGPKLRRQEAPVPSGSQEQPIELDSPLPAETRGNTLDDLVQKRVFTRQESLFDKGVPRVRQSLILLEEVDILFAEDRNFWPAVIDLIAASRRPVVMTCNDDTVVPLADLPLQTILEFEAPSEPLLRSYIQCLGLANGRTTSEADASQIVHASKYIPIAADTPDQPLHPLPCQEPPPFDLRQAINQLQFNSELPPRATQVNNEDGESPQTLRRLCPEDWTWLLEGMCDWSDDKFACSKDDVKEQPRADEHLKTLWRFMEQVSVADGHMNRRPERTLEALAIDRYEESADDEMGYQLLLKVDDEDQGAAFYSLEEEIALESLAMARGYLEGEGPGDYYRRGTCPTSLGNGAEVNNNRLGQQAQETVTPMSPFDSERLSRVRADHQRLLAAFVDEVVDTADVPLLPRPAMILDYVAYIQRMVRIDDEQEALAKEGTLMGGFSRRRGGAARQSSRIVARVGATHERYISLGSDGQHAARASWLVE